MGDILYYSEHLPDDRCQNKLPQRNERDPVAQFIESPSRSQVVCALFIYLPTSDHKNMKAKAAKVVAKRGGNVSQCQTNKKKNIDIDSSLFNGFIVNGSELAFYSSNFCPLCIKRESLGVLEKCIYVYV